MSNEAEAMLKLKRKAAVLEVALRMAQHAIDQGCPEYTACSTKEWKRRARRWLRAKRSCETCSEFSWPMESCGLLRSLEF